MFRGPTFQDTKTLILVEKLCIFWHMSLPHGVTFGELWIHALLQ
jgi:hypothetical protein